MKTIDLSMSYDDGMKMPSPMKEKYYPELRYEGTESLDLPHEGEMTVKFVKTGSSQTERDGKTRYSCTIEVREIKKVKGEEVESPTRRGNESEDALDREAKKMMSSKKESY